MAPKVIVIGAGFGGLQCAKKLAQKPVDVLVIDRNNYHLFTPLLYQVASSLLDPSDIAYPVRAAFRRARNVRFRVGEVTGIDFAHQEVRTADGDALPYDYLVIAAGSTDNFFGLTSVENVALGLKDLPHAVTLRTHVIRAFETAAREIDPAARAAWLTFVVVGAGPTGVEYAGALSELIHRVLARDYPELDLSAVRIILIEAQHQVLPAFPPHLGLDARRRLEKMGVDVRLGVRVLDATERGVRLSSGEEVGCRTLVWAAGVKPETVAPGGVLPRTRSGRMAVDQTLRVPGHPNVFAIGDIAGVVQDGRELAMMSPQAMQEGRYVARAIVKLTRGKPVAAFRYRDKGIMATIGRHAAVAQVGKLSFRGPIGWLVWLVLHLYYITGFRNRLVVFWSWMWNYIFYDRPIRLLTGSTDHTDTRE
ncbi:MAG: NAD(P)/FAD-dependent oxidoreductase [Gemmatimonadetes bacterium]|nr:NAD(P)/FAD-dependent oxidoreductase [Gemmatimonadota bacterium]